MYTHCIYIGENTMKGSIQKWGNSLALRIPKGVAQEARLARGTEVEVTVAEGALVVRPARKAPLTLASLLRRVSPENLHAEQDWGRAGRDAL